MKSFNSKFLFALQFSKFNHFLLLIIVLAQGLEMGNYACLNANPSPVIINEFMSANYDFFQDEDYEYPDWIELYNRSNAPVNLEGWRLSDDTLVAKWTIPSYVIEPGEFLLIYASGKNRAYPNFHTSFKINSSGEYLVLSDYNNEYLDTIAPQNLTRNNAYGRLFDGEEEQITFYRGSPGYSNNLGPEDQNLSFSHESGLFNGQFNLLIEASATANNNSTIYYSFNGNDPNPSNSFLLENSPPNFLNYQNNFASIPTTVETTNGYWYKNFAWRQPNQTNSAWIIKARSFSNNQAGSDVYTKTYFSPETLENSHFPIVSLVCDSSDLFSYDRGIYVPGKTFDTVPDPWTNPFYPTGNYSNGHWERPAHFSFFSRNGELKFEQNVGIRIHGAGSAMLPMKSLRIYAREKYGTENLNYPFFPALNISNFKRIILRNSGQDFVHTMFKDALIHEVATEIGQLCQASQASTLYLNGAYWGIHNMRERIDKYFIEQHTGFPNNTIEFVEYLGPETIISNPNYLILKEILETQNIEEPAVYTSVSELIDIENCIDYHIIQLYFNNSDWPINNYKMWRSSAGDGKFRWLFFDLDRAMGLSPEADYFVDNLELLLDPISNDWPNPEWATLIIRKLLQNKSFQKQFLERFEYLLNNNFEASRISNKIDQKKALYQEEIDRHIARWAFPKTKSNWNYFVNKLTEFANERQCYMLDFIEKHLDYQVQNSSCENQENNFSFQLGPNPINKEESLNIIFEDDQIFEGLIKINSISGAEIYQSEIIANSGQPNIQITNLNLHSGLYIVSIKNLDTEKVQLQKLIVH